ncbi:MAG: ABC transporter substrate-binding protein [Erysipelothrix sp.]|nr:ABC transporter substrate-binding protein [Erysipelothrix sp.]
MKKSFVMIVVLMFIVGCGSSTPDQNQDTITIKHSAGESEVVLNPQKVVIFDIGILDMYQILDLPVAGVPQASLSERFNAYRGSDITNVGTLKEPNYEVLAEMQPDLIIISARAAAEYDELSIIAPTINLTLDNEHYLDSLNNRLDILKQLYPDKDEAIESERSKVMDSVDALKVKTANMQDTTLFVMSNGDTLSIYGPGSRFGFIYDELNFKPLANIEVDESTHGQQIGFEFIAQHNPQYIIVLDRLQVTENNRESAHELLDNELISITDAYFNNNITYVDPFAWYVEAGGLEATHIMLAELDKLIK